MKLVSYTIAVLLLLAACGPDDEMPPREARNLGSIFQKNLGNRVLVSSGTPAGKIVAMLKTELDVPQAVTFSLKVEVGKLTGGGGVTKLTGSWIIQWGSGAATLENQIEVDGLSGVVVPLHGSNFEISFRVDITTTGDAVLIASAGGGTHAIGAPLTDTRLAVAFAGVPTSIMIPPYAKRVQVHRPDQLIAVNPIQFLSQGAVVLSETSWPASEKPFTMDIPGRAAYMQLTPVAFGTTYHVVFELGL